MATYLPGVTDYLPQIQPFRPDFNFYSNVLERKQQQYDVGYEKVNSLYNSMLNAPMSRDSNVARRDDFFKKAEFEIKRLGGVDLSLPQNIDAAYTVFKPFYEDDNMIHDMSYTKKVQSEMARGEMFRTCLDETKCGGKYWEGGMQYINYKLQEFKDASDQEALGMRAPNYVPYQDVMGMATKMAEESGLSIQTDSINGRYIVTTKNGKQLQVPLMNYFMARMGDNQGIQDYYRAKAYLLGKQDPDRAQDMYSMDLSGGGEEEGADPQKNKENNIQKEEYEGSAEYLKSKNQIAGNRLDVLMKRKKFLDTKISKKGLTPDSPEAEEYYQLIEDIKTQKGVSSYLGSVNEGKTNINNAQGGGFTEQMNAVIAQKMLFQDLYGAAQTLSYRDYEQSVKADPYALAGYNSGLAEGRAQKARTWEATKMTQNHIWKMDLKRQDYLLKNGVGGWNTTVGGIGGNVPLFGTGETELGTPGKTMDMTPEFAQYLLGTGGGYGGAPGTYDPSTGKYTPGPATAGGGSPTPTAGGGEDPIAESPLAPVTGVPDSKDSDITDTELAKQPENQELGDWKEKFDVFTEKLFSIPQRSSEEALNFKAQSNQRYLSTLFNLSVKGGSEDDLKVQAAQLQMLEFGNLIQSKIQDYEKYKKLSDDQGQAYARNEWGGKDIQTKTEYDKEIAKWDEKVAKWKDWPSNTKNIGNLNPGFFSEVIYDYDNLVEFVGGDAKLYDWMDSGDGVWVNDPVTNTVARKKSFPQMSDTDVTALMNKRVDIMHAKDDAFRNGVEYTGEVLSKEEEIFLQRQDYWDQEGGYERGFGFGIDDIPELALDANTIKMRSNLKVQDLFEKKVLDAYNNAGNLAAQELIDLKTGEGWTKIQESIAKNLWIPGKDGGRGRLATNGEVYNGIIADKAYAEGDYWAGWRQTVGDLGTEYTETISFMEKDLGFKMNDKNSLYLLLGNSDYQTGDAGGEPVNFGGFSHNLALLVSAESGEHIEAPPERAHKNGQIYSWMDPEVMEGYDTNPYYKYADQTKFILDNEKYLDVKREGDILNVQIKPEYMQKYGYGEAREGIKLDMAEAEIWDPYWESIADDAQSNIYELRESFVDAFQAQEGPFELDEIGGGIGSFTSPQLSYVFTPWPSDEQSYINNEFTKEAISEIIANPGKISGKGDMELLRNVFTDIVSGREFSKQSDKIPMMQIQVLPIKDELGTSQIQITFDKSYLKTKGYFTYEGGKETNTIKLTQKYKIKDANSKIFTSSLPTAWDTVLNGEGSSYTDDSYEAKAGNITYTNVGGDKIKVSREAKYFNVETGKYEPVLLESVGISLKGTDWLKTNNNFLDELAALKETNEFNERIYREVMGTNNSDELLQLVLENFQNQNTNLSNQMINQDPWLSGKFNY